MGLFVSLIHIHNRQRMKPEQFEKKISQYLTKKGLIASTKEDAHLTYHILFSEHSDWVTLSSPEYDAGDIAVREEAEKLSKAMKTSCLEVSVCDSDFVILNLFDFQNKQKDTVAIGHVYNPEEYIDCKGKPECWLPFLAEGATWEGLQEIWNKDYVFAEEALFASAPLLGIDGKNIVKHPDFDEIDDAQILPLYFKTTGELFIKEEATKLAFYLMSNFISGVESSISFYNIGGVSKGLTIVILGDCFEKHAVGIGDMKIRRPKNPNPKTAISDPLQSEYEFFYAKTSEFDSPDGRKGFIAEFADYEFFEGINNEHPSLKGGKLYELLYAYQSHLSFTATILSGEKHEFSLFIIPRSNWDEGQVGHEFEIFKTKALLQAEMNNRFGWDSDDERGYE